MFGLSLIACLMRGTIHRLLIGERIFVIFLLGTFVMRAAGCVINDFADREFDPHVRRTANRPLARGVVSPAEALVGRDHRVFDVPERHAVDAPPTRADFLAMYNSQAADLLEGGSEDSGPGSERTSEIDQVAIAANTGASEGGVFRWAEAEAALSANFALYGDMSDRMMTLAAGSSVLAGNAAMAQAKVDEKDPQAVALGYVADAKRVDVKKYPKFAAGQNCANCALYQGKAADKAGGCPLFAAKVVAAAGWCSAWVKKA